MKIPRSLQFLGVFLAVGLVAQEPTFRVDRTLVVVNVSLKDKSGNPITNLKKDDFELSEDGIRQTIGVFELETLKNDLLPPVDFADAPRTLQERVTPTPGAAAKPANTLTAVRHQDRRLLALFFDFRRCRSSIRFERRKRRRSF